MAKKSHKYYTCTLAIMPVKFLLIFILLIPLVTKSQIMEARTLEFLKANVVGDTVQLNYLLTKPIEIDSLDFIHHLNYEYHHELDLVKFDSIIKVEDTISDSYRKSLMDQIATNNQFLWNQLGEYDQISTKGKTKKKLKPSYENFSLPIFIRPNIVAIYHLTYSGPTMAGVELDFWKFENGEWSKYKFFTIWMS